jgi:hypothetical protein
MVMTSTLNAPMSDAALCRVNNWPVGTILEGDEGNGPERIRLTAIGEFGILAVCITRDCQYESSWTLHCRDWKKVGP